MRKILILITVVLFIIGFSNYSFADSVKLGLSMNYYSVEDSLYRELYGKGNFMFGVFLSFEVKRTLELRGEWNYFRDKGEMTLSKEEITFTMIMPFVLGARIKFIETNELGLYIGAGLGVFYYKESFPPRFEKFSESATSFHLEGGSYLNFIHRVYLDLNIRYIKADVAPYEETMKLGGVKAGIGIGYRF